MKSVLALLVAALMAPVAFANDTATPSTTPSDTMGTEQNAPAADSTTTTTKKKTVKRGKARAKLTKEKTTNEKSEIEGATPAGSADETVHQ